MTTPTCLDGDNAGRICPAEFVLAWHATDPEIADLQGYCGGDFVAEVRQVADAIDEHQRDHDVKIWPVSLILTPNYSQDDGYTGIDTCAQIPGPSIPVTYLATYGALDEFTTDRNATGLAAAFGITKALVARSHALAHAAALIGVEF